jgi:long-subunit fatty acid transport protein
MLCFFVPFTVLAQKSEAGNWLIYFGDKKLSEKFNWHHEVQYRNFDAIGDTEQLLIRTGVGYNLTEKNNNLHLGYAFIYSEPYLKNSQDKTNFNEHRIYQQFITKQSFGRFSLQHRYRFEQRFFDTDFRLRLRYFLGLNIAINKSSMANNTLYFSGYNEIFINTENNYFDRNRVYGGLGYRFSSRLRSEIGLMHQMTNNTSRNQINIITFFNF